MRISKFVMCVIVLVASISAATAFREDFDTLDSSLWQVYSNNGNIAVNGGVLQVSAGTSSTTFPYAYLKVNPFPTSGDFTMRARMKFDAIHSRGSGMTTTTQIPTNGLLSGAADPYASWGHWADTGRTGYDTAWHDVEWRYSNGMADFYLDGVRHSTYGSDGNVYNSPFSAARPTGIWLGNPCVVGAGSWTSFEIDYIEVTPVPEPTAIFPLTLWASVMLLMGRRRAR